MRLDVLLVLSLVFAFAAAACDSPKPPVSLPGPDGAKVAQKDQQSQAKPSSVNEREPLLWELTSTAPPVDDRLMDNVTRVMEQCAMEQGAKAPTCQDPASIKELEVSIKSQGAQLLAPLVIALSSDDLSVRRVAAWMLSAHIGAMLPDQDALSSAEVEQSYARLAELLAQSRGELGPVIAPIFVALAIKLDRLQHLRAVVDAHPLPAVSQAAYQSLMRHARFDAFPIVQHLVEEGVELNIRRAALAAPRELEAWTEQESAQLCPWAMRILESGEELLWPGASLLLRRCGQEAYDVMLEHARSQLTRNRLKAEHLASLDYLCGTSGMRDVNPAQCEQLRALHEQVVTDEGFSINIRVQALRQLQHQWPDDHTASMAASLTKHAPLGLLTQAAQEILSKRAGDASAQQALKRLSAREREASKAAKP